MRWPSESGSGTRADPYRSLTKALTHPFTSPRQECASYLDSISSCVLTQATLVHCQYHSPLSHVSLLSRLHWWRRTANCRLPAADLFAKSATSVLVHDLFINGLQRLLRGCSSCMHILLCVDMHRRSVLRSLDLSCSTARFLPCAHPALTLPQQCSSSTFQLRQSSGT